MTIEPRCPFCNTIGTDNIVTTEIAGNGLLVYCGHCGAIYGVLPSEPVTLDMSILSSRKVDDTRISLSETQSPPGDDSLPSSPKTTETDFIPRVIKPKSTVQPTTSIVRNPSFTTAQVAQILSLVLTQKVSLTDYQASQLYFDADNKDDTPKICPTCQKNMVKLMVPDGLPRAGQYFWVCPNYQTCKQWIGLDNGAKLKKHTPKSNTVSMNCPKCKTVMRNMRIPKGHKGAGKKVWACSNCQHWEIDKTANYSPLLVEMGQTDLTQRRAEYEAKINARMRLGRKSTQYLKVAMDEGPPYCDDCRIDMTPFTIPAGLPNSGRSVWRCPNNCGNWEASEE